MSNALYYSYKRKGEYGYDERIYRSRTVYSEKHLE